MGLQIRPIGVIVFGVIKRNGQVKAMPIAAHSKAEVMSQIQAHTREGSLYYTDEWQAYATLRMRGEHVVIRKEKGKPVGRDHINGIEGFWSYAKNWLYPYRGVPAKYFHSGEGRPMKETGIANSMVLSNQFEMRSRISGEANIARSRLL